MRSYVEKKIRLCDIPDGEIISITWTDTPDINLPIEKFWSVNKEICQIKVKLKPTSKSNITVELWLPDKSAWNGKFLGTGNGGFAGIITPMALLNGVSRGYATANTDMGTTANPDECIGIDEIWKDFGYRATHLMTVVGKKLTECFYEETPSCSYFMGGSTGGQQALSEAQRYPEDYDGIVCFAPAHDRVKLHTAFVWNWKAIHEMKNARFDSETAKKWNKKIVNKFAELSGSSPNDNFLSYPGKIVLTEKQTRELAKDLLNEDQIQAIIKIYQGPSDPVTGEKIFSPYTIGTENEELSLQAYSEKDIFAYNFFYLFRWIWGKNFDFLNFDFHKDYLEAKEKLSIILDASNTDITPFMNRGGKLLMISGMSDAIIPYRNALHYYQQVVEKVGDLKTTKDFFRYFTVPGFAHTMGGPGVQELGNLGLKAVPRDKDHDAICALEEWVENGNAPDKLLASAFKDNNMGNEFDHDRPAYAYPYVAQYKKEESDEFKPMKDLNAF